MARRKNTKANSTALSVDFTGVETRVLLPEGVYLAKVEEIKREPGDKGDYLAWKFRTIDDDPKLNDKVLYNNTSLAPQSLWVLRNMLETLGVETPEGPMDIDLTELVGLELNLYVEHEEYQGKNRAKVVDFAPAQEEGEEEVVVDNDEAEEGELYTEEEVLAMSAAELDELVETEDLKVKKLKKLDRYRANVVKALEEADLIGEAEEAEEEGEAEEGDGYTEDEINEMEAEDLDEIVEENELKITARQKKRIAGYRKAVIAALEEADLIVGGEEEEEEGEGYTEEEVNAMSNEELQEVIDAEKLDVKLAKRVSANRSKVLAALEEADLIVDDE